VRPDEPDGRPPSEEDVEQLDEGQVSAGEAGESETPPPATFAGRQRAAADDDSAGEEEAPEVDPADELELPEDEFAFEADEEGGNESEEAEEQPVAEEPAADEEPPADKRPPADEEPAADEESPAEQEPVAEDEPRAEPEPVDAEAAAAAATAEADTLALADREAAREAAMAGLKARAAKQEAKRETATHAAVADAAVPPEAAEAAEAEPVEPEPAVAAAAGAGEPPKPRALWARFLAASLVIMTSMATATAVTLLLYATDIAEGLGGIPGVTKQLAETDGGEPQTILILGSDKRPTDDTGRSDTAILLRVDPGRPAISLLSIPRDLKVSIPGHSIDKFNAAYSYGGPSLTLETVTRLTGLDVNHVVNINFTGFADAVNALDCVYIDVDRSYFIPPESGIAEIDIDAGYQRLCGLKALQYVRFRHEDNDLVRSARQQDFLREARQGIPPSKLVEDRHELLDIFEKYTTSDNALKDPIQVIELIKTLFAVRNAPVHEVHFPAELGGPDDPYVTVSNEAIQNALDQFLGTEGTPGPAPSGTAQDDGGSDGAQDGKGAKGDKGKEKAPPEDTGPAMIDATGAIQPYAQKLEATETKDGRPMLDFPLYYPTQVPADSSVDSTVLEASRAFPIDGPGDDEYRGYKFVLSIPGPAGFPEYFGASGTDWENPPILDNPSETREIEGREYDLFYDGDRLRLIGWKTKKAAYWVNNTLLQTLDADEMLAIARSLRELGG
jgi:polyisoprenyl-teichoic acid--peptidoglycan teichoic acid transferase